MYWFQSRTTTMKKILDLKSSTNIALFLSNLPFVLISEITFLNEVHPPENAESTPFELFTRAKEILAPFHLNTG